MLNTKVLKTMQCSRFILGFLSAFAAIWTAGMLYDNYNKCTTKFIEQTCGDYVENNRMYNKYCESVCVKKNVVIEDCLLGTTPDKKVFLATIQDKKVVLKVGSLWFGSVDGARKALQGREYLDSTTYFTKIVFKYLGSNCTNCGTLVTKLLSMADADASGSVSQSEAISFGSLLLTREVFMLAALNGTKSTINFYGYCGPMYIIERVHMAHSKLIDTTKAFTDFWFLPDYIEYLESYLKSFFTYMRDSYHMISRIHESVYIFYKKVRKDSFLTLEERLDFVIGMVELVYDMVSWDYGEMFSCDLHLDNIGFSDLSNYSLVKQTDLDEVFAAAKIFQDVQEKRCKSDIDCAGIFDVEIKYHEECSSFCEDNGFCSRRMEKDNLAFLCEKLFVEIFFNPVAKALSNQELPKKMTFSIVEILNECKKPFFYLTVEEHLLYIRSVADRFHRVKQLSHIRVNT